MTVMRVLNVEVFNLQRTTYHDLRGSDAALNSKALSTPKMPIPQGIMPKRPS